MPVVGFSSYIIGFQASGGNSGSYLILYIAYSDRPANGWGTQWHHCLSYPPPLRSLPPLNKHITFILGNVLPVCTRSLHAWLVYTDDTMYSSEKPFTLPIELSTSRARCRTKILVGTHFMGAEGNPPILEFRWWVSRSPTFQFVPRWCNSWGIRRRVLYRYGIA